MTQPGSHLQRRDDGGFTGAQVNQTQAPGRGGDAVGQSCLLRMMLIILKPGLTGLRRG
jgi:hypothetical protein